MPSKAINKNYLGRVDYQISSMDNVSVRGQRWSVSNPSQISSGTSHPSTAEVYTSNANNVIGTWNHLVGTNMTMQVTGGINKFAV